MWPAPGRVWECISVLCNTDWFQLNNGARKTKGKYWTHNFGCWQLRKKPIDYANLDWTDVPEWWRLAPAGEYKMRVPSWENIYLTYPVMRKHLSQQIQLAHVFCSWEWWLSLGGPRTVIKVAETPQAPTSPFSCPPPPSPSPSPTQISVIFNIPDFHHSHTVWGSRIWVTSSL
jgi:hypothetical protein